MLARIGFTDWTRPTRQVALTASAGFLLWGSPTQCCCTNGFLVDPLRDTETSVSEHVGDVIESAVEDVLDKAKVSYRKTKRAERMNGFDQAPDFIIPSEFNPQIIIEAKLSEDDGTARDKVTRIQHLGELSRSRDPNGEPRFRSRGLYRWARLRRPTRGYEEDAPCYARQSFYPEDDRQTY